MIAGCPELNIHLKCFPLCSLLQKQNAVYSVYCTKCKDKQYAVCKYASLHSEFIPCELATIFGS